MPYAIRDEAAFDTNPLYKEGILALYRSGDFDKRLATWGGVKTYDYHNDPAEKYDAAADNVRRWFVYGGSTRPHDGLRLRRQAAGFSPQIFLDQYLSGNLDKHPYAAFIEAGKPEGPWLHPIITATKDTKIVKFEGRVALHIHAHFTDYLDIIIGGLRYSMFPPDLLITTSSEETKAVIQKIVDGSRGYPAKVEIRIVPNRGRDIGPFITAFADVIEDYDVVGHVHMKRSADIGERGIEWRNFLMEHMLGGRTAMIHYVLTWFQNRPDIGIIFPEDPHVPGWDHNKDIAVELAKRMGIPSELPDFFDFPVGNMFWVRPSAIKPLLDLKLGWDDYPQEPLDSDGTMLHALERLTPFIVAQSSTPNYACTYAPGVVWRG